MDNNIIKKLLQYYNKKGTYYEVSYNTSIISYVLKKKRLERKMTLKEVSDCICSVSYLSKIESNKMVPNEDCLRGLMERLNISKNDIIVIENSKELISKAMDAYLYLDTDIYKTILCYVTDVKGNLTAELIKAGYYCMIEKPNEARDSIIQLINSASTLNDDMLNMLSIFTCEYILLMHNYDEIYKTIQTLEAIKADQNFMFLIKDVIFRCYVALNKPVLATKLYYELVNNYTERSLLNRLERIRKEYTRMLFENKEYQVLTSKDYLSMFGTTIPKDDDIKAFIGISYYELKKEIQAREYLDLIAVNSPQYCKYINYIYNVSLEKENFIYSVRLLSEVKRNFYLKYFIGTINNDINTQLFESKAFMDAYSNGTIMERVQLLKYKADHLIKIFKYKDAVSTYEKIEELKH